MEFSAHHANTFQNTFMVFFTEIWKGYVLSIHFRAQGILHWILYRAQKGYRYLSMHFGEVILHCEEPVPLIWIHDLFVIHNLIVIHNLFVICTLKGWRGTSAQRMNFDSACIWQKPRCTRLCKCINAKFITPLNFASTSNNTIQEKYSQRQSYIWKGNWA